MSTKQHIISACVNYSVDQLLPFLHSLELIEFRGILHAIVAKSDGKLIEQLESRSIRVQTWPISRPRNVHENRAFRLLQFLPIFKHVNLSSNNWLDRAKLFALQRSLSVSSYRYIVAKQIVQHLDHNSVVLLTDSRDVYFQCNPFEFYRQNYGTGLALSLETHRIEPGNITYKWLQDVYGSAVVERWIGRAVCCSGTTIADRKTISGYLDLMIEETLRNRTRISHTVGYDQGLHNYLFYDDALESPHSPRNGEGPFFVVQQIPKFDTNGLVRSTKGHVIPLIHQFDRATKHFLRSAYFRRIENGKQLED